MSTRLSLRARAVAVAACLVTPVLAFASAPAAFAAPAPDPVVASGDNWTVTTAPGGYVVTYELDEPLPIVDDAPTLLVDGKTLGFAAESADGLSLSITTTDPAVASAGAVEKSWSSGETDKAAESDSSTVSVEDDNDALLRQLDALAPLAAVEDPSDLGQYTVTEAEYDFGDRAVPLAGISGIRGEMTGKMYLTDAPGARPTVVLLHGRHSSCSGPDANPLRWPCGPTQMNIRSYQGYEGTGRALASQGYNVLSIAANAVNSNDNQLALDYGAQARGQLVLDTLGMLQQASAGQSVAFDDVSWPNAEGEAVTTTRTLDQALSYATTRGDAPSAASGVTAASLQGRFDLTRVGVMGHSRGGEGATSAATLNQGLEKPYGIISVLPLAPVDFGRMTVPDVPLGVFLPYCDGDVSNQQGQHMIDDSRHAFGDDTLRSAVWIMGANHNFFNTVWTPGLYPAGTGDDWSTRDLTSSCSTTDSTRMTAAEQYQVGVSYMTGFFRLTMGGETKFQSLFDGSVKPSTTATGYADVRVMASQPKSATTLVTDFAANSTLTRTSGAATAQVCSNLDTATALPQPTPFCASRAVGSSRVPHWTPVRFGPNVPFAVTRVLWTGSSTTDPAAPSTGELRVSIPSGMRDVSTRSQLTVKTAPDESVPTGTDFTVTVLDGKGNTFSRAASAINPLAINRMPGGTNATLNKIVLQQLTIPTAEMTGIDLTDVREVRFTAGIGADGTGSGGVYLSDLAFDTPTLGTPVVQTRTTMNIASTIIEEGDAPSTTDVAVYLNRADTQRITGYISVIASTVPAAAGTVGAGVKQVTFAPGETCQVVTVPVVGNDVASPLSAASFTVSATNTTNAVMGSDAFGALLVREDDGTIAANPTTPAVPELPPVGTQGDACAEYAASVVPGELTASSDEVAPGGSVVLTGTGFRVGESVAFTFGDELLEPVIANADGIATITVDVADDATLGATIASASGLGSGRVLTTTVFVLAPTTTELAVVPTEPVEGESVRLVATVTGDDTEGEVTFTEVAPGAARAVGDTLGTAPVVDGTAVLELPAGLEVGDHTLVAAFARTDVAGASESEPVTITVTAAVEEVEPTPPPGTGEDDPGTDGETPGTDDADPAGDPDGVLPATGGDAIGWGFAAAAALLVGAGATMAIRRRRSLV
ncbi:Ig-like domain repeat protein [Microbacterium sp. P07]|uniref:Ig-like domain repeat protein n=1 Tax=Microbacterium sp. P07 TaxID=3366952 RepID=UPI0037477D9B